MGELPSLALFKQEHLRRIMSVSKVRSYEPEEYIIKQGQFDCWIYIIISGAVRVEREGKEVARLQRIGDIFGEMGVISGEARSADVIADKATTCLAMDGSVFDRHGDNESLSMGLLFYRLFSEVLAMRLRESNEELVRTKEELAALKSQGNAK